MKPRKNTILVMLLGLLLVAFAVGIAQTTPQGEQKKKAEACCAMETYCCNSGSCPMKHDGANAEAKEGCCGASDSCEMKNHSAGHPDCCGDSCDMKHHGKKHDSKKHEGKAACCKVKQKDSTAAKQKT